MVYKIGDFVGYVTLADEVTAAPVQPQRWFMLQTYANKESKVMRTFRDRGISAYYPTLRQRKKFERRRSGFAAVSYRDVVVPLFAGLIFIPDFQVKLGGLDVDGVAGFLMVGEWRPWIWENAPGIERKPHARIDEFPRRYQGTVDMAGVRAMVADGNIPVARRRRLFQEGQRVRIIDGPFASFPGMVDRLDSRGRLNVLLDIFKRMTPVEFDECQIEPA